MSSTPSRTSRWPDSAADWWKLTTGLAVVYFLFDRIARQLGSDRGQSGWLVAAVVVAATTLLHRVLAGGSFAHSLQRVGLGWPKWAGIVRAVAVCVLLAAVIPVYASATDADFSMYPNWPWLAAGMFLPGGVAEEVLFRGYLFGQVRNGRSFWPAALLSSGPFVLVHLVLFTTLPAIVAVSAVLLAVAMSFPLALLFELGGRTIWAPALVHWMAQVGVKAVVIEEPMPVFAIVWMAACAVIPFVAFVAGRPDATTAGRP